MMSMEFLGYGDPEMTSMVHSKTRGIRYVSPLYGPFIGS